MKEPKPVKLTQAEGEALIQRIKANQLEDDDRRVLEHLIQMYFWLLLVVQEAKLSMKRLKRLIVGGSMPSETPSPIQAIQNRQAWADGGRYQVLLLPPGGERWGVGG